jgi:hypothetical protein
MGMMSCEETKGGVAKKKPAMVNSQPGSTSHVEEALGGKMKKKMPPAHVGFSSTSHEDEALGGMAKKRISSGGSGGNKALGDAKGAA